MIKPKSLSDFDNIVKIKVIGVKCVIDNIHFNMYYNTYYSLYICKCIYYDINIYFLSIRYSECKKYLYNEIFL